MPPIFYFYLDDLLTPGYSAIREQLAPTRRSPAGAGAMQLRRELSKPLYRFRLKAPQEQRVISAQLASVFAQMQGDTPMVFSGLEWGSYTVPLFVGFGDGARRTFSLPNRRTVNVTVYQGDRGNWGTPLPIEVLNWSAGTVTLSVVPPYGAIVRATYTCDYVVVLQFDGDIAVSESMDYADQYSWDNIVLQEVPYS